MTGFVDDEKYEQSVGRSSAPGKMLMAVVVSIFHEISHGLPVKHPPDSILGSLF